MSNKTNAFSRRTVASAAAAIMLALASSTAFAVAPGGGDGDDDDANGKSQACGAIGCPNGSRLCGTVSGKITAGVPPFVGGEVAVSWTCYENPASF